MSAFPMQREERIRAWGRGEIRCALVVRGEYGAIEFWWSTALDHDAPEDVWGPRYKSRPGGVEVHSAMPLYAEKLYDDHDIDTPSHDDCELTPSGKCWHDGSSLWASETLFPSLLKHGHEAVFKVLEERYQRHAKEMSEREVPQ